MARLSHLFSVFVAIQTCAAYSDFYFASQASKWKCNALTFDCIPPQACVRDGVLNKTYCCGSDSQDAVCSGFSTDCGSNNQPLTGQIGCDTGEDAFCCLDGKEKCTQRVNQINVCWGTTQDPYSNVSAKIMNDTFSSLSSAHPRQTTFAIDTVALLALATATSTASTTGSATSSPTGSSTPTQSSNSDSGLSGGAIGGIVVGVVGGLALIGLAAFFYWRRASKKTHHGNEMDGTSNAYAGNGYGAVAQHPPHEKYAQQASPQPYNAPLELDSTHQGVSEVEGSHPGPRAHPYN
ncbi:hypothetical protein BDV96DRAFT_107262 [Lophiotrema nucula]|uniref:Mid2 domain-containing protein n=1 Tax=Lophiotrema nucula TaxID=690887 RepID=A0A6A5Z3R1_9PLEO|nr:hypothetical protein BDV96DRAFT_107262 [Lophiotrema nucula]